MEWGRGSTLTCHLRSQTLSGRGASSDGTHGDGSCSCYSNDYLGHWTDYDCSGMSGSAGVMGNGHLGPGCWVLGLGYQACWECDGDRPRRGKRLQTQAHPPTTIAIKWSWDGVLVCRCLACHTRPFRRINLHPTFDQPVSYSQPFSHPSLWCITS